MEANMDLEKVGLALAICFSFWIKSTLRSIDEGECIDVVFLDFAKAFDKVPHRRLMEKLEKHGISGKVWNWISKWMSGKSQRVHINGYLSAWRYITSGVPQGSILGPILFLIFINDLESGLINNVIKFADDTKLLGKVNSVAERNDMQHDLQQLMDWSSTWLMPFNTSKCNVMHLGRSNPEFDYVMVYGGCTLETVVEQKDLGVPFTIETIQTMPTSMFKSQ